MNVVENYWSGVLQRLQAEVDVFNRLIEHQGEKGQQNELSLARVIERLVPRRYGVGSGLVIDADGSYSSQTDIIIYNQSDEPSLMAQAGQVLYPIENVRACIEVKTSASSEELKDCGEKVESLRRLNSRSGHRPIYAFLGYNAKNYAETLANTMRGLPVESRPDFLCVLKVALFAEKSSSVCNSTSSSVDVKAGVAELHSTADGARISREYISAPDSWEVPRLDRDGVVYPLVKIGNRTVVGEPSRALMLFCEGLLRGIAAVDGRGESTFSHYIPEVAREVTSVG